MPSTRGDTLAFEGLNDTLSFLWDKSISERTSVTYQSGLRCFTMFLMMNNLTQVIHPLPGFSENTLLLFIAYCFKTLNLSYSTIKLYLCGIRFAYLRAGLICPLTFNEQSKLRVTTVLKAIKRVQGQKRKPKRPITATTLRQMCSYLDKGYVSSYTDCLLKAVCVTAFFGFLKCSEFSTNNRNFDSSSDLCRGDLTFHEKHAELYLRTSKTDPFRKGVVIRLFKINEDTKFCPYSTLKAFCVQRNAKFNLLCAPNEPLFLMEMGDALSRAFFIAHLHNLLNRLGLSTQGFSPHCFRVGTASSAWHARLENHLIKTLGRWSSDCYKRYIRISDTVIRAAQVALIHERDTVQL